MKIIFYTILLFSVSVQIDLRQQIIDRTNNNQYTIFLVKQRWHTGIVIKVSEIDTTIWPEINDFRNFDYVDAGWGDSAFYQNPNFNIEQAAMALFVPTASTLRIYGFNSSTKNFLKYYDAAVEIKINGLQLKQVCKYIHCAYYQGTDGKIIIYKEEYRGRIKFYKAKGKYDIFNTCNTWIARGLNEIGFNKIDPNAILAEELFRKAAKIGEVVR